VELEGVVHNGIIVPTESHPLPEGTRVKITTVPESAGPAFGERYARFKGAVTDLPPDLAAQHDHYRLGTPKR
jgi:hypothetical protein